MTAFNRPIHIDFDTFKRAYPYGIVLSRLQAKAEELKRECAFTTDALEFLLSNVGTMQLYTQSARSRAFIKKYSRTDAWADELIRSGDKRVELADIIESLGSMDEAYMLRADEIWNAPNTLRLAAARAFISCSKSVLRLQREWLTAERWAAGSHDVPADESSPVFFEHALKLAADSDDGEKRAKLTRRLALVGRTEDDCFNISRRMQSEELMRLENIMHLCRTLEQADWEKVFNRVSFTERTLNDDPSGVYGAMDDSSKDAVRHEAAYIASRTGFSERAIASLAVETAKANEGTGVCDYLYTDKGRKELLNRLDVKTPSISRITPDPSGRGLIGAYMLAFIVTLLLACAVLPNAFVLLISIPALWFISMHAARPVISRFITPRRLLKLNMEYVPNDARTLVVIPALIPNPARAEELANQLEALGALDKNENLDFLLLGDFADSKNENEALDKEIIRRTAESISRMNDRSERAKYFYLHRNRVYNQRDGIWLGRERKRGALNDLNLLLNGGENRFTAESANADKLKNRYRYVLTIDADTRVIPGSVEKLIGAIHHPLNRPNENGGGYCIIQPRMEISASSVKNRFVLMLAGAGGADTYQCVAPDIYQDACGMGVFGGKGIYDVRIFAERTRGAFDDNTILSHDLLEGVIASAAYAGDIVLFEGFPLSPSSYLKRLERWTRGDWQLLRYMFGRVKLKALDRFKMADNMLRSLSYPSACALLVLSVWLGSWQTAVVGLLCAFAPWVFARFRGFCAAFGRFLLLPSVACTCVKGAARALYRSFISHKKLLEWTTAADAEAQPGGKNTTSGIALAILLIPAIARLAYLPYALILACAFVFGRSALDRMSHESDEALFTSREFGLLMELARDTWRYFERFVPVNSNGLPPDNVQLDPPIGAAERTSPTNIGMYMVSCVSALELGLIDMGEMHARLRETVKTLEKLDKWNGLIYNWYDTKTLEPLKPRYVSSVDCGNLLACLILVRNAVNGTDERLNQALSKLISEMDLYTLYDPKRKLFRIGFDVERERPSESHYDLLASEARILSYVAIAEKGVPVKHWSRLGRPCVRVKGKSALMSWSGTMFEYMMPFIFMPSAAGSLLGVSARSAVSAQMRDGGLDGRPWGVSECAYRAFDAALNYQYRAFGVPELAISRSYAGNVIAPYATLLALSVSPDRAFENIPVLTSSGLRGEFGMYEAIDYSRSDTGEVVYSYMTHHQGMALCAMCNALTGDRLQMYFMNGARERAVETLLNEKPFAAPRLFRRARAFERSPISGDKQRALRAAQGTSRSASPRNAYDGHLLFGAEACAFISADGRGFYRRRGVYANMWRSDFVRYEDRILPDICDETGKIELSKVVFDAGYATYSGKSANAVYEIGVCISPETGALVFRVRATANAGVPVRARARQAFMVALAGEDMIFAHPVFSNLFVSGERYSNGSWRFTRRKRDASDSDMAFVHTVSGGTLLDSRISPDSRSNTPLRPESALEVEWQIPEGETKSVYFTMALIKHEADTESAVSDDSAFERALTLSGAQARTMLAFTDIMGATYRLLDRASARIVYARQPNPSTVPPEKLRPDALWQFGLSGDEPILLVYAEDSGKLDNLHRMIRAHEFYKNAGLTVSFVILVDGVNDYLCPNRDTINSMLAASHLSGRVGERGYAYVIDIRKLERDQLALLKALAAICVRGDFAQDLRPTTAAPTAPAKRVGALDMHKSNPDTELIDYNGFGGFAPDGRSYIINLLPGQNTPAAWSNILSNPTFGCLITERGGGFIWHENSRSGRLTPFDNDPEREGWGARFYALNDDGFVPLIPTGNVRGAYTVRHSQGETAFECGCGDMRYSLRMHVDCESPVLCAALGVENKSDSEQRIRVLASVDWLMGIDMRDMRLTRAYARDGMCFSVGRADGVGCLAIKGASAVTCDISEMVLPNELKPLQTQFGNCISAVLCVPPHGYAECAFVLGWAADETEGRRMLDAFSPENSLANSRAYWDSRLTKITVSTGDFTRDALVNRFFKYQALACRVFARTGLYQPGGAFGMRDQLQDMLCVLYMDSDIVRSHILYAAAHQFESGDGMHWWHAPNNGVRTRITDDILFLPFVCAKYVLETGDSGILAESVPYLADEVIPDGQDDWYGSARVSEACETLNEHCMRAFRRADNTGAHGLCKIGAGDWNDGMNRVGHRGIGESVWLSEFLSYTARLYAEVCPESDKEYLSELSERLRRAVDESAWDGDWYIRAIDDNGKPIGSRRSEECRIDLISQAWAALNGQDAERVKAALNSADTLLVDRAAGLIRLLAPPFTGKDSDPGYIAAYPPGVRENGGQYTHAACWLVAAYARLGDSKRAWEAFRALLPSVRAQTHEAAVRYRGEPYAAAADICSVAPKTGTAGWTWYTGAAGWAVRVMTEELLGLKIRGSRVKMSALLENGMEQAEITLRIGASEYRLISSASAEAATLDGQPLKDEYIELTDDGKPHTALFPSRRL